MYCANCGAPVPEGAAFCITCGKPVAASPAPERTQPEPQQPNYQYGQPQYNQQPQYNPYGYQSVPEPDAPNIGLAILSFFVPVVGIILYCIWRDQTPLKAKSCLKGALTQIIICAVFGILGIVLALLIPAISMGANL